VKKNSEECSDPLDERRKTMFGKSIISRRSIGILISMIATSVMLTADDSFAFERKVKAVTSRSAHPERVVEQRDHKVISPRDMRHENAVVQHRDREKVAPRIARHERETVNHRQHTVIAHRDVRQGRVADRDMDHYSSRTTRWNKEERFPSYSVMHRHFPSRHVAIRPRVGVFFSTLPFGYRTFWTASTEYYYFNGIYYQGVPSGYVVVNPPPAVVREYPTIVEPAEDAGGWVSVTVSTLNIHSGPALNYPVIDQVTLNSVLEVYGRADGWVYVQMQNGGFGWILSAFTTEAEQSVSG
jgi:hypothetical protein